MINSFDKKALSAVEKIISVILVLLVIASVLMFLFKVDLLNYLRNLPGPSVPEQDQEIEVGGLEDEQIQALCPVRVGGLFEDKIFFCKEFEINCKTKIFSNLKWDGNENNAEIEVSQKFIFDFLNPNDEVGEVRNSKIFIYPEIREKTGALYKEVKGDLPDQEFQKLIQNLHEAYYVSGNLICRKEVVLNV